MNLYAYDAYFLDCALCHAAPLLTLVRSERARAKGCNPGPIGL